MKETVLIAGASGLIGKSLIVTLSTSYSVRTLTRKKQTVSGTSFYWNPQTDEIDPEAFTDVSCVINLSGENISANRWTAKQKEKILLSRTQTAETLLNGIAAYGKTVTAYISASAIGFYGMQTSEHIYDETVSPGNDFLARTCVAWETEAERRMDVPVRKVYIRTGIVLSNNGGVLREIQRTLPFGILPVFGSGKQYMPWIHIKDLCELYKFAIQSPNLTGAYNAVSSSHCTNEEFIATVQSVLPQKTVKIRIPAFLLHLALGQMAGILLNGSRISSQKIQERGFFFTYDTLQDALNNL